MLNTAVSVLAHPGYLSPPEKKKGKWKPMVVFMANKKNFTDVSPHSQLSNMVLTWCVFFASSEQQLWKSTIDMETNAKDRHVGSRFSGESTHQNQIENFCLVLVRNGWSWFLSLVSKHFHLFHFFQLYHGFHIFHLFHLFHRFYLFRFAFVCFSHVFRLVFKSPQQK